MARKDKTFSRIQNISQNPKHVPESKKTSQNTKTVLRIENTSQKPKNIQESKILPESKTQLKILESVLDSGKCFVPMSDGSRYLTLQKLG